MNAKNDIGCVDDDADPINGTKLMKQQMTTVFYPDDQIGAYRNFDRLKYISTTPMNLMMHESSTIAYQSYYPSNHRKSFDELFPEVEERSARDDDIPSGFRMHNYSSSHVVFPDDTVESSDSHVNSIRDILDQIDDDPSNETVFPSPISRGRGMRIAGTYRYKQYDHSQETLATMQSMTNTQQIPATHTFTHGKKKRPKDLFSKFKPKSMSDVNLLAMNQVRVPPYTHNRPRPLLRTPVDVDATKQKPFNLYANQNAAESMYNQIVWANKNHMKMTVEPTNLRNERMPKNQKPFSLMLDVYPMPNNDDEMVTVPSTRYTSHPIRPPQRHPIYPRPTIDANTINHNLQYASDNSYYNQINFPQLQSYHRMPNDVISTASYVNGRNPNYHNPNYYYRNYNNLPKRQNVYTSNQFRRPASVYDTPSDDTPSQITVHLNLFSNKKKAKSSAASRMQNIQILDSDHLNNAADDNNDDNDNEFHFYKRRIAHENPANKTHSSTMQKLYNNFNYYDEPPFRPLKSSTFTPNWLMPRLNEDVNSTNTSTDKSIAEDMSPFHSSFESIVFDATTNYENIQNNKTSKSIFGNHSMVVTANDRRLNVPESMQSNTFSKSSSAHTATIDDVNRTMIFSTLSTNVAETTQQQQQQQQQFPILIETTAIADANNDEIMRRIKFPEN